MTQNYLALCPERANLRQGLDMKKLDNIVIYLRRYLTDIKKKESGAGSCEGSAGSLDDYLYLLILLMFTHIVDVNDPKYYFTVLQCVAPY